MGSVGTDASGVNAANTKGTMPPIIDIRSDSAGIELRKEILAGLRSTSGEGKTLPTLLLYDELGLKLFERITYLDQYYLTNDEINVLEKFADRIAERIPNGAMVVELGSGNLRKVKILLDALDKAGKKVYYYALDLMKSELDRTLELVPVGTFKHVECHGLHGTYDDGLEWLKRPENAANPKVIMSLGSSIGNFTHEEAVGFIAQFASQLGPKDTMLIGLDASENPSKIYNAYNDRGDVTHDFTMNGLKHANKLLGHEAFKVDEWEAIGQVIFDRDGCRHRASVVPLKDVTVEGIPIKKGEKVRIEESFKYSAAESKKLWRMSEGSQRANDEHSGGGSLVEGVNWANESGSYALHLLSRPAMHFPLAPEQYAEHPVPGIGEWHELWKTWDLVTRQMIPNDELYEKPIKLRNACIFYLGHIPTFFDMKLTEATNGKPTEPSYFYKIFERGIDPDVDNPEKVHAHSEIPDTWPALDEILLFQKRVRERVENLYKSGQAYDDQWTGRALWLGFEHEIMHLETLLYMLIQSEKTLPPPDAPKPDFEQLAAEAERGAVENEWFDIPEQTIQVGLEDPDTGDGPVRYFGWDVEKPPYAATVKSFKAKGRPITNSDYAQYLIATGEQTLPSSWETQPYSNGVAHEKNGYTNGTAALHDFCHGKAVRTLYGLVPLELALHWPVSASYDELDACAKYMGGRIPSLEEARSIYHHAHMLKQLEATKALGKTIPAVNGHLVNNGVQESPPSNSSSNGHSSAAAGPNDLHSLFHNLEGANVGLKHWHPMPVTQDGGKLAGIAEMGGLWEWTSSALEKVKGFEPMKLYPAYSADFYDGKHNVVLGGSWATHPRVAGRNTFVNWYQHNYPYVWAGARIVKDA